jgi:hypothetical protein
LSPTGHIGGYYMLDYTVGLGYSILANPGHPLIKITRLDFNSIASHPLALSNLGSRQRIASFELLLIFHTIALHQHTLSLNHRTQHGIYQAL